MLFKYQETRESSDNFRYPLIVAALNNAQQAAQNPLYEQPVSYLPCMNVNTVTFGE